MDAKNRRHLILTLDLKRMNQPVFDQNELERRKIVWGIFSALFLDTSHTKDDLDRMAKSLSDSSYSIKELKNILKHEVAPIVGVNLLSMAGEWAGFDQKWLQDEILKNLAGSKKKRKRGSIGLAIFDWWKLKRLLKWKYQKN